MLAEQPCPRDYGYSQQGAYLTNQRVIELKRVMEELKPFPLKKNEGCDNGVLTNESHAHQLTQIECYTIASSLSSKLIAHNNPSYIQREPPFSGRRQSKSVCHSFPKINHEVTAFGRKHAEYARRLYQSEAKKPEFQQVIVPPYQPNYGPMELSYCNRQGGVNGSNLLGDSVRSRDVNKTTTLYTKSAMGRGTSNTVLKVARIAPRPKNKRPKSSSTVGVTLVNKKIHDRLIKKSDGFQDRRLEIHLKNAPLFQILCEISKT